VTDDSKITKADIEFAEHLQRINKAVCPSCGHTMDRGDVSWNSGDTTGEGTPLTWAQIVCQSCGTEVAYWRSWYFDVDDFDEFVAHVLEDLE
jgi:predicted RNA-binding Zn-ribbon protein involved in translation (DUF1610 family)